MKSPEASRHALFLVVAFIFWVSHFIYVPVLAPYIEFRGGGYVFAGLVLSSYGVLQLLCRMPVGILSDMLKIRKHFIVFGMAASTASCLMFALSDHLGMILAARSLAGLAAATWVVFTVLYSGYFSNRYLSKAMGNISLIVVLGQFFGMAISGYLVDQWGWKAPFWTGGAMSLAGMLLSFFIFETKENTDSKPVRLKDLSSVIIEPLLWKISMLSIVAHGILFTTMFGFTPSYALHIGFSANEISLIVMAFMIPHAISAIISGNFFVPLLGQWRTLQLAFSLVTVFTFLTPFIHFKLLFFILQGLNGFSLGLLYPVLLAMAADTVPPEKRATAIGLYQALYAIGMFAGPFFGGILNSYMGIKGAFYFSGALGLIAVISSFVLGQHRTATKGMQQDQTNIG